MFDFGFPLFWQDHFIKGVYKEEKGVVSLEAVSITNVPVLFYLNKWKLYIVSWKMCRGKVMDFNY